MPEPLEHKLSRRERQIMDLLFQAGQATAAEIRVGMPDPPSDSAVRTHLRILEQKGHIQHEQDGPRYLYRPTVAKQHATRSALRHMVTTFFNGSAENAMAALLGDSKSQLSEAQFDRLEDMIRQARSQEDES